MSAMCFYLIKTLLNNCKKGVVVEEGVKEKSYQQQRIAFLPAKFKCVEMAQLLMSEKLM